MKNKHNISVGSEIERSNERIDLTGEVFTPMELCVEMVNEIPLNIRQNPDSTFLDNAAGNGNFIIALRDNLKEYHSEEHIVNNMLYAVELMEDNHKEMCERLGVPTDHPHYVCHDALTYDYSFGEPEGVEQFML
tara:strand:+ start:4703 stop:5104 length:402 start_codon:yes stop_codon:yes gene_type:complete